jgi:hypothetical protein
MAIVVLVSSVISMFASASVIRWLKRVDARLNGHKKAENGYDT